MESKKHFKMYKNGKLWCTMAISAIALGIGLANNVQPVHAAAEQTSSSLATSASSSSASDQTTDTTTAADTATTGSTATQATSNASQASDVASATNSSSESAGSASSSVASAATSSDASSQAAETSDGSVLISDATENGVRTVNKALAASTVANGLSTQNGKTYDYVNGKAQTGIQTVNGHEYYFD